MNTIITNNTATATTEKARTVRIEAELAPETFKRLEHLCERRRMSIEALLRHLVVEATLSTPLTIEDIEALKAEAVGNA